MIASCLSRLSRRRLLVVLAAVVVPTAAALGACSSDGSVGSDADATTESGVETSAVDGSDNTADAVAPSADAADADADADAGSWTPAQLDQSGDLALWLEPTASNFVTSSGTVAIWKDRSSHHNDAKNASGGPTIHAALLNGHDTLHFDVDVKLSVDDAPSLQLGLQQLYVTAVARMMPGLGAGVVFSKATSMFTTTGGAYTGGFELWAHAGTTDAGASAVFPSARIANMAGNEIDWDEPVFDDSKFHIISARRITSSELALAVDDQPQRVVGTGSFDLDEVGRPVVLGALRYGNFTPPVDFDIAEIIVVHGPIGIVADADVANVHAYLKKKYAL